MVRIGSRKWTTAQIEQLTLLLDAGVSAPRAAIVMKRSVTVVRIMARNIGKKFSDHNRAFISDQPTRGSPMQKFFFDMKDGVPLRDHIGIEFKTNAEAIGHCKEIAQHFRDESLRNDQDLEISVVNALGREIHREFVHREP
jgi:hypothetical protein